MYDALVFIAIGLACGVLIIFTFCKIMKQGTREVSVFILALFYRLVLTYLYYIYFLNQSLDARGYFNYAVLNRFKPSMLLSDATDFIKNISAFFYPFAALFDNSYLMLYLPFTMMAFLGSLIFYVVLKKDFPYHKKLFYCISFFIPGLVFWTSMIGKDAVVYLGLMLIIYGSRAAAVNSKIFSTLAGALLVYKVRPHVVLILSMAFVLGFFIERYKAKKWSWLIYDLAFVSFIFLYKNVLQFTGFQPQPVVQSYRTSNSSENGVEDFYVTGINTMESKAKVLNTGGSAANRTSVRLIQSPLYAVGFICGPFFWQARKPMQYISAIEGILYQVIIIYLFINWKTFVKISFPQFKYSYAGYILLTAILLGMAYTNYGLVVRQKCMITPFLLLLSIGVYSNKRTKKIKTRRKKTFQTSTIIPSPAVF